MIIVCCMFDQYFEAGIQITMEKGGAEVSANEGEIGLAR